MKHLQQVVSRGRASLRRLRAVAPGSARDQRPVRLVLRLPAPDAEGTLGLGQLQRIVVETVHWLGPLRVCVRGATAHNPLLEPVVRFANRLECPTHVVTAGPLLESDATGLVDAGVAAVTLRIGALDEAAHLARTGTPLSQTLAAADHLRRAREDRGRPLGLFAALCLASDTVDALGAMAGLAGQSGVDGVLASLPADPPAGAGAAVAGLAGHVTSPALLAALDGRRPRRPAGLRLEVLPQGQLRTSRHLPILGTWKDGQLQALWEAGGEAVTGARDLLRPADEVERVPAVLYSAR